MAKMNAVGWFDIYVDDLDRAVGFYQAMLDTTLEPMGDPTGETQMTIVYFMVEDCATQQERTEKAGGRVIRPKFSIGEFGWVLICQDTEGNMIGFNSMK